MGSIVDEFDFLIDHSEDNTTFVDDSNKLIHSAENFLERAYNYPKETYQGITLENIANCISIDKSDIYTEKHVIFTLDVDALKDTNGSRLREFKIPQFIEELRSIGDKANNIFGYNQYNRNFLKTLVISSEVKIIAPNTFALYKKLENIIFEKDSKLIYIGSGAFDCCEKLKRLDLRNCEELDGLHDNALKGSYIETLKVSENFKNPGKQDDSHISTIYIGKRKIKL